MRRFVLFVLIALLPGLPAAAQSTTPGAKEPVVLRIDAELLRRAREMNLDLDAMVEKQLQAELGVQAGAPQSHEDLLVAAFDNFEAMMFEPLKIDQTTPKAAVRDVCRSMLEKADQLVAHAELRKSMELPTTLEEAQELDQLQARRFQALQARMGAAGSKMQASHKIIQANCADLDQDETATQDAMKTALGGYGPVGWCRVMMRKPQAQWNMEDAGKFAQLCQGVKLN